MIEYGICPILPDNSTAFPFFVNSWTVLLVEEPDLYATFGKDTFAPIRGWAFDSDRKGYPLVATRSGLRLAENLEPFGEKYNGILPKITVMSFIDQDAEMERILEGQLQSPSKGIK